MIDTFSYKCQLCYRLDCALVLWTRLKLQFQCSTHYMHTVCNDHTSCTTSIKTLKDEAGMAGPKIYACGVYTNPMIKLCTCMCTAYLISMSIFFFFSCSFPILCQLSVGEPNAHQWWMRLPGGHAAVKLHNGGRWHYHMEGNGLFPSRL